MADVEHCVVYSDQHLKARVRKTFADRVEQECGGFAVREAAFAEMPVPKEVLVGNSVVVAAVVAKRHTEIAGVGTVAVVLI